MPTFSSNACVIYIQESYTTSTIDHISKEVPGKESLNLQTIFHIPSSNDNCQVLCKQAKALGDPLPLL